MTQFATAQELRTYLTGETLVAPDDDEWTAQADLLLSMISADIQTGARNKIAEGVAVSAKLPGTWSRDLTLPQRPVTAVTSVALNGVALLSDSWEWNERGLLRRWNFELASTGEEDPPTPHDGAHWGGPASTVTVVYSFGYATVDVPDVVKSLALRVAARTIDNVGGVAQETLGPYSVSYGNVLAAGGSHLTDREVQMLRKTFGRTAGTQTAGSI